MRNSLNKVLALTLAFALVFGLLPVGLWQSKASAAEDGVYVLDATADLPVVNAGDKKDGDFDTVGTDGYFTLIYAAKTKIDGSKKNFDDGYSASQRINFQSTTNVEKGMVPAIGFTTASAATIKLWWVSGGDGRQFAIYDSTGNILTKTEVESVKNSLYITELTVDAAGAYFLGLPDGSNYLFKMEVTEKAAGPVVNAVDFTTDMAPMDAGAKADGDTDVVNGYFTVIYKSKTKIDSSSKTFDDGYAGSQRLNIGGKTEPEKNMAGSVMFKTANPGTMKVWWVSGGDGREIALYNANGEVVTATPTDSVKNALYISELEIPEAGTYYLGVPTGSNYIFKIEVTEMAGGAAAPERAPWADVAAPVIVSAVDNGEGQVNVTVNAEVGLNGGDELLVTMLDEAGNEVMTRRSVAEKQEHVVIFEPESSGNYTFRAVLVREKEADKAAAVDCTVFFSLPLTAPILVSATSKGNGTVELVWTAVLEAERYEIFAGAQALGSTEANTYLVEGLTVGETYSFTVKAHRGAESTTSAPMGAIVTETAQRTWGFTSYGPSSSLSKNGYEGSVNADGYVTVYSEGNGGKIQPNSHDGLAFYYTAIPTTSNFTLRAKVTVDSWSYSNGQEGFGLMVTDALGVHGDGTGFYNNAYMAVLSKVEYRYVGDGDDLIIYDVSHTDGTKISMKLGMGAVEKIGVTPENQATFNSAEEYKALFNKYGKITALEWAAADWGKEAGTYNIVGNYKTAPGGDIEREMRTEFILEIQKNNTGYFITYYNADGSVYKTVKYYTPDALNHLDTEYVYAGFFASRNARVTFSDVVLNLVDPQNDAPAEERPVTKIQPTVTFGTDNVSNSLDYSMMLDANVDGTVKVVVANKTVLENVAVKGNERAYLNFQLAAYGENRVQVFFTPDANQDLGEFAQLSSTKDVIETMTVVANKCSDHNKVIYVAPTGLPTGNGTKEQPLDIYTAVDHVTAGQVIVLMEGTYLMNGTLRIKRGFNGTENAYICMIADPAAKTRPVLDFQGLSAGIVHGGNYWYFQGFDVTRSQDGQKGFQVSGSNNILDQINTYYNGNTGVQISRYGGKDLKADWPANNLILNCTSYCNYDAGFEDADGFAAKLTVGEGNVFDGCVAYNNADDGWDLFAKLETGSIGAVTIRNCVAHSNGFVPGVEGQGNGNGFKMGGDSLSGKHVLENSYAFFNLAKGIDSNSCPDIIVKNSVSYNNGSYNVAFYTNNSANTAYVANGIISLKDSTTPYPDAMMGENLKPKGTQDVKMYEGDSNYYWTGSASVNAAGATITADAFVSLTFTEITRNADGSINMNGFLERSSNAPANAGTQPGGTASQTITTLPENGAHNLPDAWSYVDHASGHWRECDCGFKGELAEHTYQWVVDSEPTPTASGLKHEECTVCGYKRPSVTTYYEEPTTPTNPTEPTEPTTPSEPTNPTEATQPSTPSDGTDDEAPVSTALVVMWVILLVVVVGSAAVLLVKKFKK